jgi:4-alpha-glucanotransferase
MSEQSEQELLSGLAEVYGIAAEYYDIWGRRHAPTEETKRAILAAMGVRTGTAEDLRQALIDYEDHPWRRTCDPVLVIRVDHQSGTWAFRLPVEEDDQARVRVRWEIRDEAGRLCHKEGAGPDLLPAEDRLVDEHRYVRLQLPLPSGLSIGYYDLAAVALTPSRFVEGTLRLIIAPTQCYVPPPFLEGRRTWGLALQLYAFRSSRNWGMGDFGDLADLLEWAAKDLGAGIIGLNPLHALKNTRPNHISPYSPDSRLYTNMLYLDVERIPEFQESGVVQRLVEDTAFKAKLEALRRGDMVDYDQVAAVKTAVLEACFATFEERHLRRVTDGRLATERGRAFDRFV